MLNRRNVLSGLAVVSLTSVSGCSGSLDTPGLSKANSQAAKNTVREFWTGTFEANADRVNENLHPDNSFHPVDENSLSSTNSNNITIDSVKTSTVEKVVESQKSSSEQEDFSVDRIKSKLRNKISELGYSDYILVKTAISSDQIDDSYVLAVEDQGTWYVRVIYARSILEFARNYQGNPTSESEGEETEQAEQTGEETTSEVSDLVQIGNVVGEATSGGGKIKILNATLRLASGSDPINLTEVSYAIETPNKATFVNGNPSEVDGLSFRREQSLENDTTIISEQEDIMIVEFDLSKIDGVDPVKSNTKITFIANSPAGARSVIDLETPRRISGGEKYIL